MDRSYYLDLARQGLRMPIGADLVLREKPDHHDRLYDGQRLGEVLVETARRFQTPLAFPLMDLTVEKEDLLMLLGLGAVDMGSHHFEQVTPEMVEQVRAGVDSAPQTPRNLANAGAIRYVAGQSDLVAVGMAIGPFSLMTKLLADPITPVFLAGSGMTGEDEPEVGTMERSLELSELILARSLRLQAEAGARAVCLCEPAANQVYVSPRQIEAGGDVFERLVMQPNLRVKALLDELGMDLIFHDCGELIDPMIQDFTRLDPAILSMGSSRRLWEDARMIPESTVMYGNLPSKKFYSDTEISVLDVERMSAELVKEMRRAGQPFILGTECDVLSIPGSEQTIFRKVDAMMGCCV